MYSVYKLKVAQRCKLQQLIGDDYSYMCGAKLEDLHLGEEFKDVEVKDRACGDPIKKLYYSAGFEPMCLLCS